MKITGWIVALALALMWSLNIAANNAEIARLRDDNAKLQSSLQELSEANNRLQEADMRLKSACDDFKASSLSLAKSCAHKLGIPFNPEIGEKP